MCVCVCTQAHACANHVCAWVFQSQHAVLGDVGLTALVLSVCHLPHLLGSPSSNRILHNALHGRTLRPPWSYNTPEETALPTSRLQ